MGSGILEVTLMDARGLASTDFLNKIDPYVIIQYKGQERKSSVARGQGSSPVWNEKFTFRVDYPGNGNEFKLVLNIMDKDTFSKDDFVGQATIQLRDFLEGGIEKGQAELAPTRYRVILADRTYRGDVCVGLSFTAKEKEAMDHTDQYGGWVHSRNY